MVESKANLIALKENRQNTLNVFFSPDEQGTT
jgi:hypothetical protein